ncbi:MAG TPA: A24 family peptidase, partial [Lacipirellulaceae bacterium]|nr:A24 family peptidase [Lacipirellulaceae bacterium]
PLWQWQAAGSGSQPPLAATLAGLILALVAATATITDLAEHRIPNWITYPAILWWLGINIAASTAWGASRAAAWGAVGWQESVLGMVALFGVMLIIFSFTGGGAGDVKLCGSIGALLGLNRGVDAVLMAMVAAGLVLALWLVVRHGPRRLFDATLRPLAWRVLPRWVDAPTEDHLRLMATPAPLGPFFALGIVLVLCDVHVAWTAL